MKSTWASSTRTQPSTGRCERAPNFQTAHSQFVSDLLQGVPATVEGMLGGFGRHSTLDINFSRKFITPLIQVGDRFMMRTKFVDSVQHLQGTSAVAAPNRALGKLT